MQTKHPVSELLKVSVSDDDSRDVAKLVDEAIMELLFPIAHFHSLVSDSINIKKAFFEAAHQLDKGGSALNDWSKSNRMSNSDRLLMVGGSVGFQFGLLVATRLGRLVGGAR